jgi:hypothetical protein
MSLIQNFPSTHQHWIKAEAAEKTSNIINNSLPSDLIQRLLIILGKLDSKPTSTTSELLEVNKNTTDTWSWAISSSRLYKKETKYADLNDKSEKYLNSLSVKSLIKALDSEPQLHHLNALIKEGLQRTGLSPNASITSLYERLKNTQNNIPDAVFLQKFERALYEYQGINWAPSLLKAIHNKDNPFSNALQSFTFLLFHEYCQHRLGNKDTTELLHKIMSGAPLSHEMIDKIASKNNTSAQASENLYFMPPERDEVVHRRNFLLGEDPKEAIPLFETALRYVGQMIWSDLEDYMSNIPPSISTNKKDLTIKEILESNPTENLVGILFEALENMAIKETVAIDFSKQDTQNTLIQFFISV